MNFLSFAIAPRRRFYKIAWLDHTSIRHQLTAILVASTALTLASQGNSTVGIRGHGFLADNGNVTTIDAPGAGLYTVVFGLGDGGQTVGGYVDTRGRLHGFVRTQDSFTPIDVPGATATGARQINDRGQIVGAHSTVGNHTGYPTHGFLRDASGTFTTIDVPGATFTSLVGINDRGQMVGQSVGAGGLSRGFVLDQGVFTTIDVPGAAGGTGPVAINNRGQIVGLSSDGFRIRGFLLENGTFTRITPPGAFFSFVIGTFVTGIDDRGRIAGTSL